MVKILIKLTLTIYLTLYSLNAIAETKSLRIPLQSTVISLDPAHIQDMPSLFVSRQINCQLVRNNGSVFNYDAAKSIKYISPLAITVTLNETSKFIDGSPVTAIDVQASFDYIRRSRSVMRNIFSWVDKVEVVNQSTLIFHLKKPIPQFFKVLSSPNYAIFKKSFLEEAEKNQILWNKPIGCGDYRVTSYEENKIQLDPVKNALSITFYPNKVNQIAADDIIKYDIIGLNIIGNTKNLSQFNKIKLFDPSQVFIGLNTTNKQWRNKNERCAFLSKLNINDVLNSYDDTAIKANDLLPTGTLGYSAESKYFESMRSDFMNSKIPNHDTFCLSYLSLSIPDKHRQSYFNMVKKIYPHIVINSISDAKQFGMKFAKSDCDAIIFSLKSNYLDGYEYLQIFANNDANYSNYQDNQLTKLITNSQNHDNSYERSKKYREIISKVEQSCLIMPLITVPMRTIYVRNSLSTPGIGLGPLNEYQLSQVTLR